MSSPLKVFITGASSGIGEALAADYARRGAILGLVARRGDALAAFQQSHPQNTISVYSVDVRDAEALAQAAQQFIAEHGCPDIVIANAGISRGAVTGHGDLQTFRDVMDINYFGMVATFEPFAQAMVDARKGALVGIASVAGVRGLPGSGAYSASKSAAAKYLEALRVEMRPFGVSVVTIAPGYIRTAMTAHNPYSMPFLMDADRFAAKVAEAIARKKRFATFPWQMRVVSMLLHVAPRWLYDAVFEKAPRKPRAAQ
ncbi:MULTISPECIES: SDR family oxidoreductase [Paraburkholderia]|jgi:short-subunit dehydrogenase|uniref:Short-chain dehydrogenase n=1 Tax=Paraburkholderia largidicola TaxID=3014751 RepID=A0A7I8BFZ4_9BURK|nr:MULTISPECIES: SDR family oxidoreductase [Paraburkholderia]BEU20079.1 SDR family oxidoreductase [Paraburkholderia sp. 22B1P]GJH34281.1 SDR family oxidoreductase [Paraburkholderia hospita]CAG9254378.1 Oxidoreductase, short-chain dehydrogenase/reductase family [Paraburkholderia caribensis]BCF87171.1 short-chain dehydrogenase [Paraburkholderia sp. PGU16]GJG99246.1 SDR family oxidoreductase [Paraburkholderia terrae]